MLIGQLAKRGNTLATTIRYYERIGLLNAPLRMACGYRDDDGIVTARADELVQDAGLRM